MAEKSVICCHLCHNFPEAVKELRKSPFSISIYIDIGQYTILVTPKKQKQNTQAIEGSENCCGLDLNKS